MNLWLRLLWSLLSYRWKPRIHHRDCVRTHWRVMPADLDLLRHMNNGRYFTLLDLARLDLVLRSDIQSVCNEKGWYSVVASEMIRFRKALNLFVRFDVETFVEGWDNRFFYISQKFMVGSELHAAALVKVRFLKFTGGAVDTTEVAQALGDRDPKKPPQWALDWSAAEEQMWGELLKPS